MYVIILGGVYRCSDFPASYVRQNKEVDFSSVRTIDRDLGGWGRDLSGPSSNVDMFPFVSGTASQWMNRRCISRS